MADFIKTAIVDYRTDICSVNELERLGIKVIKSLKISSLYEAVCGHTDMQFHYLGKNKAVCAAECYNYYNKLLPGFELVCGKTLLKAEYPYDILYNAAAVGNFLICREKYTAKEILREYKNIINVRQGYSKCSVCIVEDNAIITADKSIIKAVNKHNIDALEISEGHIELTGMPYGFIGGATGLISKNLLAVNGDIKTHPDSDNIIAFCRNYGVDIVSLKKGRMQDIGSIVAC